MPKRRYDKMAPVLVVRKLFPESGLRKRFCGGDSGWLAFCRGIKGQFLANSEKQSFPKRNDSGILEALSEHDRQPIGICDSPVIQAMFGAL